MKLVDSPPAGYEGMQIYGLLHLTQSIVCLYCTCQDVLYLISVRIVYRRRWRWRWCCASWPRCSSPHMCSWPYQRGGPVWWSDCGRWWCRSSCHLRDLWPPHSLTTPPEKRRKKKKKKKRGEHNVKKKEWWQTVLRRPKKGFQTAAVREDMRQVDLIKLQRNHTRVFKQL